MKISRDVEPLPPPTFVKCVDSTLQNDVLVIGRVYEVVKVDAYYDGYVLDGLGKTVFSKRRFVAVP